MLLYEEVRLKNDTNMIRDVHNLVRNAGHILYICTGGGGMVIPK
jgi:hypothetical protein